MAGRPSAKRGPSSRPVSHRHRTTTARTPPTCSATGVPFGDLVAVSDFVVLALPLTGDTLGMVDAAFLARMKSGARLINPARGSLADEFLTLRLIGGESGSGTGTVLRNLLGSRAVEVAIAANVGSTEAVKSAVKAGLGASVVLEAAVSDDVRAGRRACTVVETAPLFKTFYVARPAALPDDDAMARFARSLMVDTDRRDHKPADRPSG